jgi:membrane protein YqaA with SNARE-associated domain
MQAHTASRVVRIPTEKRRHRRTFLESMRHWIYKNGTWAFVVLGLSFLGSILALRVGFVGKVITTIVWGHS